VAHTDNNQEPEFIDNPDAPVMIADGLYDVEVIGQNCWFLLFQVRRTAGGIVYREPAFWARLPNESVGPGIALTIRKAGGAIVIPAITETAREIARALRLH
jgi:hypothetical protein